MRSSYLVLALLFSGINAVKQQNGQVSTSVPESYSTTTTSDGNMGQTRTQTSYSVTNFEQIKQEITGWFGTVATPKLEAQRKRVFEAAFAEAEDKHGALLETCDQGTLCRKEVIDEIKVNISKTWKRTINDFRVSVEQATKDTKKEVNARWQDLIQCQIDKPCCDVPEIEWYKNTQRIIQSRKRIIQWQEKWTEFEHLRIELEVRCPVTISDTCEALGPCEDGSQRDQTNDCLCPHWSYPACPATTCNSGLPRQQANCLCLDDPQNLAVTVWTERHEEEVKVKWTVEDPNIDNAVSFQVFLDAKNGYPEFTSCLETEEEKLQLHTCTFNVAELYTKPYYMDFEEEIFAQIRTEYDNLLVSEASEVGGGAFTPAIADIPEPRVWTGYFIQQEKQYDMAFEFLSITDFVVAGAGTDDIGEFTLLGQNDENQISFKKEYSTFYEAYSYLAGDPYYIMYEATLTNDGTKLSGIFENYDGKTKERYKAPGNKGDFDLTMGPISDKL